MSLSFLYRAFCRVLQLVQLSCTTYTNLAIEVAMLRHEVAAPPATRALLRPAGNAPALAP